MNGSTTGTDTAQPVRVTLVAHLPERRRRRHAVVAVAGCGCSTCCCCLHSIGGVVGAVMAGREGPSSAGTVSDADLDDGDRLLKRPPELVLTAGESAAVRARGRRVYWSTIGVLCLITAAFVSLYEPWPGSGLLAAFAISLNGPLFQLVGALVAVIILVWPSKRSSAVAISVVGRMTLGMLIGAALGIVAMIALPKLWSSR